MDLAVTQIQIDSGPQLWMMLPVLAGVVVIGNVLRGGRFRLLLLGLPVLGLGAVAFLLMTPDQSRHHRWSRSTVIFTEGATDSGMASYDEGMHETPFPVVEGMVLGADGTVVRVGPNAAPRVEEMVWPGRGNPWAGRRVVKSSLIWTGVSALALGVMIYLAYLFVDAGTRGQFTWRLRLFSAVAFVGICALLVGLGPRF